MLHLRRISKDDIIGFLLGLGFGVAVYSFLSLFEKPTCPICHVTVERKLVLIAAQNSVGDNLIERHIWNFPETV